MLSSIFLSFRHVCALAFLFFFPIDSYGLMYSLRLQLSLLLLVFPFFCFSMYTSVSIVFLLLLHVYMCFLFCLFSFEVHSC